MHKILIIEDEAMIQDLLRHTLSHDQRYFVLQATDGKRGLEMALHEEPDIILLDIDLPQLNGYEICQKVKQKFQARVKIIMVTAMAQSDQVKQGFEVGADDYYIKPFSPLKLLHKIDEILGE